MKTKTVIKFFGSAKNTAEALGIGKSAVSQWNDIVPEEHQWKLEILTKGALKVSAGVRRQAEKRFFAVVAAQEPQVSAGG